MYKICNIPRGPPLDNRKYTIRPTTTGGIPIKAFKITIIELLKKKLFIAKIYPNIKAKVDEMINAETLTFNDKKIIWYKEGSKEKINFKEFKVISKKFIIVNLKK